MAFAIISLLTLVAILAADGVPTPIFSSTNLGEKADEFGSQTSSLNENPFLLFSRPAMAKWGAVHPNGLQRRGAHKAAASPEIPFFRLTSPQGVEERYLIPLPSKRGGKVILVDIVDYISKENEEEEGSGGGGAAAGGEAPAVVVASSGRSSGGGGSISGNMMRFSGK